MNKLLVATKNPGKVGEFKNFLSDIFSNSHSGKRSASRISKGCWASQHDEVEIVSLSDLNIKEDIEENGKTYKENSQKKALFFAKLSGLPTIADDGGIEIAALNNEPGVRTRRWLGQEESDEVLLKHMMKVSEKLPENNRTAYFRTVVSLALPDGKVWSVSGEVKGIIAKKPHLKHLEGYPFRSFFYLPQIKKYYHEDDLTKDEQKLYNHRYKAVQKLKLIIKKCRLTRW